MQSKASPPILFLQRKKPKCRLIIRYLVPFLKPLPCHINYLTKILASVSNIHQEYNTTKTIIDEKSQLPRQNKPNWTSPIHPSTILPFVSNHCQCATELKILYTFNYAQKEDQTYLRQRSNGNTQSPANLDNLSYNHQLLSNSFKTLHKRLT